MINNNWQSIEFFQKYICEVLLRHFYLIVQCTRLLKVSARFVIMDVPYKYFSIRQRILIEIKFKKFGYKKMNCSLYLKFLKRRQRLEFITYYSIRPESRYCYLADSIIWVNTDHRPRDADHNNKTHDTVRIDTIILSYVLLDYGVHAQNH